MNRIQELFDRFLRATHSAYVDSVLSDTTKAISRLDSAAASLRKRAETHYTKADRIYARGDHALDNAARAQRVAERFKAIVE